MDQSVDLMQPDSFAYWTDDMIRFADMDVLGHINNKSIAAFFENARAQFLFEALGVSDNNLQSFGKPIFVLVKMVMDFHAELHYPGRVKTGTCVTRIGNSSCTVSHGLFEDGECIATSDGICVLIDQKTRQSVPIPDDLRQRLLQLSAGA